MCNSHESCSFEQWQNEPDDVIDEDLGLILYTKTNF